jgi:AcrR family transcriptional regulator
MLPSVSSAHSDTFDGKEDLYAYVARTELAGLFARVGPLPELDSSDADAFWSVLEDYYLQLMRALAASPQLAALLRGWAVASESPAFQAAQGEIEQDSLPWIVLGMGEAMDLLLMSRQPDDNTLPGLIGALISMIRERSARNTRARPLLGVNNAESAAVSRRMSLL